MSYDTADLPALIGSRICHDLISPIGAISNGLELLSLNGVTGLGPEFELIHESCANANARIRFFRVAFGSSPTTQKMGRPEVQRLLNDLDQSSRVTARWLPVDDVPRKEVQIAFLALLCLETAMPHGGDISFDRHEGVWTITATSDRLNLENGLWTLFSAPDQPIELTPSRVQFPLLDTQVRSTGRKVSYRMRGDKLVVTF